MLYCQDVDEKIDTATKTRYTVDVVMNELLAVIFSVLIW